MRDKFAASRKKGMWMEVSLPLGYDVVDRKLVVNAAKAELVRTIFASFLQLGSATELAKAAVQPAPHDQLVNDAGRQAAAGQADRQGRALQDLQQPGLSRRGGAQGREPRGRAPGYNRYCHLGEGHGTRQCRRSRQRHPSADASLPVGRR
jgi:hypothetical protein